MQAYGWTGRGSAASDEGVEMDWLLNLNFVIIIAIFFFTNFLLFYFTWKYVKKPGVPAYYYPHNNKLELIWTIVPAVVLAVIIILGLQTWSHLSGPSKPEAEKIELFSKQFDWTARYSGADNTLGLYDYKLTLDNNELALLTSNTIDSALNNMFNSATGIRSLQKLLNNRDTIFSDSTLNVLKMDLSRKERLYRFLTQMKQNHNPKLDASAWDDIIQKDTLYLCKGQEYEIALRAKDVIHSAYFPHFRAQMNTVPGMATRMKFTPNKTTKEMRQEKNDENFNYILMCNKICGGAHYKMKMIVVVLDKPSYKKWMDAKKKMTFKDQYFPVAATAPAASADTTAVTMN
jgi:cytochrome c oxidase subunit 2